MAEMAYCEAQAPHTDAFHTVRACVCLGGASRPCPGDCRRWVACGGARCARGGTCALTVAAAAGRSTCAGSHVSGVRAGRRRFGD